MNRKLRTVGLAGMLTTCVTLPLTGCETWNDMSREMKGLLSGAGAGVMTTLIASAAGMDTEEAILLGLAAGAAVGLVVYATSERPATADEQAVIARQSEEIRTQSDPQVQAALAEQQILVARPVAPAAPANPGTPAGQADDETMAYQMYTPTGEPVGSVIEIPREQIAQAQQTQAEGAAAGQTSVTEIQTSQGTHRVLILDA